MALRRALTFLALPLLLAGTGWWTPGAAAHPSAPPGGMSWLVGPQPALGLPSLGGATAALRAGSGRAAAATPGRYGDCGPDALPETGLQGQVPKADQDSGRSRSGYRCNVRRVGGNDIRGRGANFQLAFHGDCAYVGIVGYQPFQSEASPPAHPLDGLAVIDASEPARPELVDVLQSPKGKTQHEAIEVNHERGMLVVAIGGLQAQWLEFYDVSGDCRRPVFKGRYDAGRPFIHGLRISDDGRTVYVSDNYGLSGTAQAETLRVLDATDMSAPRLIATWDPLQEASRPYGIHDVEVSRDGRRLYLGAQPAESSLGIVGAGPPSNAGPSVVVLDTTEVQSRRPDPRLRSVGQIDLPNFGHALQRATIGGRPHLFASGETVSARPENCPWAWGHVIDLSDERHPRRVSDIRLEANDPERCEELGKDGAVYSAHYVGVDDERRTRMVFYTYYTGGVRAFDVRDPAEPREIAYYHPPPVPETVFKPTPGELSDKQTPAWDSATSVVRFRKKSAQLWFSSIGGGFHVVELTGEARSLVGARRDACRRTRRIVVRLPLRAGERVRSLRVRVDGRRVRARRRGRRVLVRLGADGARVTVAARTTRGRRILVRRRYPALCP